MSGSDGHRQRPGLGWAVARPKSAAWPSSAHRLRARVERLQLDANGRSLLVSLSTTNILVAIKATSSSRSSLAMPPTRTTPTSSSSRARMPRPTVVGSSSRLSNAQPSGSSRRRSPTPDSVTEDEESHTDEDDTGPYVPTSMRPRQRVRRTPSAAPAVASASSSARPVVVISSDEEDEGQGASEQRAGPSRARATRRVQRHAATSSAGDAMDMDPAGAFTSTSAAAAATTQRPDGFLVERVVRRPQPIVLNDSDATAGASSSTTATSSSSTNAPPATLASNGLPLPQTSPPRGKPPLVAHPLLSKYTCPICLCAPHPYAVSTPCGHVFCSDCLFEALQVPAKQKQDEYRQQVAAFSAFTSGGYGWPASFFGMGMGMGGAGAMFGGAGGGPGDAGAPGGGGDGGGPTAAAAGGAGGATSSGGAATSTSSSSSNNAARLDPLVGPCPVCRATIPGGFIRSAAASTSTNASGSKRPVFGLQFKLGKPIDDPRRE